MLRARVLAAGAAAGLALMAAPALAQSSACTSSGGTYPVITCPAAAVLSVTTVNVNATNITITITFVDGTFAAFENVSIIVQSEPQFLGTFQANSRGGLTATVTLPNDLAVGTHHIIATGQTSGVTVRVPFQVVARGGAGAPGGTGGTGGSNSGLVNTGSNATLPLAASGVTLVVLGGAMVAIARRNGAAVLAA